MSASPYDALSADFNGDGRPDLAAVNFFGDSVVVQLGRGDNTFAAPVSVAVGEDPQALVAGDFDGDGKTDLAVGYNRAAPVTILRNASAGPFALFQTSELSTNVFYPHGMVAADFNRDGKTDLAVGNFSHTSAGSGVTVFRNVGAATGTVGFDAGTTVPVANAGLLAGAAGDFDGDGRTDVAFSGRDSSTVTVLRSTNAVAGGAVSFASPVTLTGAATPQGIVAADLDGDGRVDLATVTNLPGGKVNVFRNSGPSVTVAFAAVTTFAAGYYPSDVTAADLDGDGKIDLAAVAEHDTLAGGDGVDPLIVLHNASTGAGGVGFTATQYAAGERPTAVFAADFDGDAKPDLAVAQYVSGGISIFRNTRTAVGTTSFAGLRQFVAGAGLARSVVTGDFDGDRFPDLAVVVGPFGGANTVNLMRNGTVPGGTPVFGDAGTLTAGTAAEDMAVADFDGDGRSDLALLNNTTAGGLRVFRNTSTGPGVFAFAPAVTYATGALPSGLVAADLNADGKTDLAYTGQTDGTLTVLNNTGAGGTIGFAIAGTYACGASPVDVAVVDLNSDDRPDLVVANAGNANAVTVFRNTAAGTAFGFALQQTIALANPPKFVVAGDFDLDGNADLIVSTASAMVALRNTSTGAGIAFAAVPLSSGGGNTRPVVTDFDGDNRLDVVVTGGHDAYLLRNTSTALGTLGFAATLAPVAQNAYGAASADFDNSGTPDLAVTQILNTGYVDVLPNQLAINPFVSYGSNGVVTLKRTGDVVTEGGNGLMTVTTPLGCVYYPVRQVGAVAVAAGAVATVASDLGTYKATDVSVGATGRLTFAAPQKLAALSVAGTAVLAAGRTNLLRVTGLSVVAPGVLDLADNDLIYDYSGNSPVAATTALLAGGRAGGAWTGSGIISSASKADAAKGTTIGYMEAVEYFGLHGGSALFDGVTPDRTTLVFKYTTYGDATFDGKTDFADFVRLQSGFGQPNTTFANGNFDYNATTDFSDFVLLQSSYGKVLS